MENEAKQWISQVVGEPFPSGSFDGALKSGVLLCKVANKLTPNAIPKINTNNMAFMQVHPRAHPRFHPPTNAFTRPAALFTRPLSLSPTHPRFHPLTHAFTRPSALPIHPPTHAFTRPPALLPALPLA